MFPKRNVRTILYLMTVITALVRISDARKILSNDLKIEPEAKPHEEGKMLKYECTSQHNGNITWILPNGTRVDHHNSSRVEQISQSLFIRNAMVEDSGPYMCWQEETQKNVTINVTIYARYDYSKEGLIVVGINCFLLLIIFTCYLVKYIRFCRRKYHLAPTNLNGNL
ncbi:hypothetical protein Ahia01_000254900 [Argonauta hians]